MILEDIETAPREQLEQLQLERLRRTVERLLGAVEPIRERLREAGVEASHQIESLADLARLPFTDKRDFREHYPFGLLAVAREELVRIHASSGTGGKPTIVGYTAGDLNTWTRAMARCLIGAGIGPGSVVHNAYGYGLFTGGLGVHQGAERIGATVVPVSSGMTARQAMLLRDLGGQALCCTPSYALRIAESLREASIGSQDLELEVGLFGAEPWSDSMRVRLEHELGLTALNIYGLSEIVGPGVACECLEARSGSHVQEDLFLTEVVDPDTGTPVPVGSDGELVFTTLTKEAMPLLRYRTGDIASLEHGTCECGRTLARMSSIRGRRDDMLIIRGVNLYPSEVERVLLTIEGIAPHYQLILERNASLDEITVHCEISEGAVDRVQLSAAAEHALREATGVGMRVEVLEPGRVPRSEGKAVRVQDRRHAARP